MISVAIIENNEKPIPYNHGSELRKLITSSDSIILCTGWIDFSGFELIKSAILECLNNKKQIELIFSEKHINKKGRVREYNKLLKEIKKIQNSIPSKASFKVKSIPKDSRYVHAKVYLFESDNNYTVICGSANIMKTGLENYDELSLKVSGIVGDELHTKFSAYLGGISSRAIDV
jgi:HKD family nuclease